LASVCSRLWKPILYSMSVVCAGFGIFILSGFPHTQRFGFSVVLGTLLSPLPALFLLPWFATIQMPNKIMGRMIGKTESAYWVSGSLTVAQKVLIWPAP